jgi:osmotically inducible lipoprotein OsmB
MLNKPTHFTALLVLPAALAIAACGETTGDRALSGAGLGAATGAGAAILTGGNAGTGALVGGALGAGAGALTDSDDFNMGKPVWRK